MPNLLSYPAKELDDTSALPWKKDPDGYFTRRKAFSRAEVLFRAGYVVGMRDLEHAAHKSFETVGDLMLALDEILSSRKLNHHLYDCTPFRHPDPYELYCWSSNYRRSDDVIEELSKRTLFDPSESDFLTEEIGRRHIWLRVVDEVNNAFAASYRSVNPHVGRSPSENELWEVIHKVIIERGFRSDIWPDFDAIAKRVMLVE